MSTKNCYGIPRVCEIFNLNILLIVIICLSFSRLIGESVKGYNHIHPYHSKSQPLFTVEKYWSLNDPKYIVCRVHNACVRHDGTILVHKDAMKYLNGCSLGKRDTFANTDDFQTSDKATHSHLLRRIPARQHIPHFLDDILPVIMSSELIWPNKNYKSRRTTCDSNVDNISACEHSTSFLDGIYSEKRYGSHILLVFNAEIHVNLSDWIAKFTTFLPGRPSLQSRRQVFQNSSRGSICFSSIILHSERYLRKINKEWFSESNALYSHNDLVRHPVKRNDALKPILRKDGKQINVCFLRGVIVNRNPTSKRHIVNYQAVQSELEKVRSTESGLKVIVNVSVVYFEI